MLPEPSMSTGKQSGPSEADSRVRQHSRRPSNRYARHRHAASSLGTVSLRVNIFLALLFVQKFGERTKKIPAFIYFSFNACEI